MRPAAALYLDFGNRLYALMLPFLVQIYSMQLRTIPCKKNLLAEGLSFMHAVACIASI